MNLQETGYSRPLDRCFTWDGIRSIDYLFSRPEVGLERISVTVRAGVLAPL